MMCMRCLMTTLGNKLAALVTHLENPALEIFLNFRQRDRFLVWTIMRDVKTIKALHDADT
jgi:hypothetical protein